MFLPEVMRSRQGRDELHGVGREAANDAVGTADEHEVLADDQAIGTLSLEVEVKDRSNERFLRRCRI
jgi:hypothetical protein